MSGAADVCTHLPATPPTDMARLFGRRGFLKAAGAAMALGALPRTAAAAPLTGRINAGRVSIQLYSLRQKMDEDLDAVFARLARIGYRKVEHAGFHGRTAAEFKAALDKHGLAATSGHQSVPYPYDEARWEQAVSDAKTLGQRYMVEPLPAFALPGLIANMPPPSPVWADYAATMNRAAQVAAQEGIRVGYHNHNVEFLPLPDDPTRRPYDVLLAETDPDLVHFEMDLYWVWKAEVDPVEVIQAHPTRIRQFHVKDMDAEGNFANPGEGVIDFERIFKTVQRVRNAVPLREYIVERDDAGAEALKFAKVGYQFLRQVRF
jgi:sugar phosphate isomerase/epimerase